MTLCWNIDHPRQQRENAQGTDTHKRQIDETQGRKKLQDRELSGSGGDAQNTVWICPPNRNLIICKRCHRVVRSLPIELLVSSNTHEGSRYVELKRDRRWAVWPTPEQINNWWVKIHHRTNSQSARCPSVRYRKEQNREEFLRHSCYRHMEKNIVFSWMGWFRFYHLKSPNCHENSSGF